MPKAHAFAPHYTVDDYQHWKGDWELWDGIAIAMSPSPIGEYSRLMFRLAQLISNALEGADCNATALGELDWIVREDTVVRPDLMILCGEVPRRHLRRSPGLVVEILSQSTRQNDLTYKRRLYAEQNVPTYLIVDQHAETIQTLTLNDGDYREQPITNTVSMTVCGDCTIEIQVADLFRRR